MNFKFNITLILVLFWLHLFVSLAASATLSDIDIDNRSDSARVVLSFDNIPMYTVLSLHNPERVIVDIVQSHQIKKNGLPINFNGANLIKCIRIITTINKLNVRLVFDLTKNFYVKSVVQSYNNGHHYIALSMIRLSLLQSNATKEGSNEPIFTNAQKSLNGNTKKAIITCAKVVNKSIPPSFIFNKLRSSNIKPIIIAIDAGHGGHDPGAIGNNGLFEKNVTIAISRKLKELLDVDPIFKPVLTRDGDYFISVMSRSELARKQNANVLVSIHADAALNSNVRGSSVWVLSNQRANSEMANWLKKNEKQSRLIGGIADLLAHVNTDPYLSHTVLDLQFGYSQRVGYEIALNVLYHLRNIGPLHKHQPEYSNLGVLRSPDIPSLLIETGFISNLFEEQLLSNDRHQEKIAIAIYKGLYAYFVRNKCYIENSFKK